MSLFGGFVKPIGWVKKMRKKQTGAISFVYAHGETVALPLMNHQRQDLV